MSRLVSIVVFVSVFGVAAGSSAHALTSSSSDVVCSASNKLQAKIDAVAAGTIASFNVSGTCNENIIIPVGKTIIIKGKTASAKITPADVSLPAVIARGDTIIQGMGLANPTGSAESVVQTDKGGTLEIISSDISGPNVASVVAAWYGSVRVINTRVQGGTDDAVEVWGASDLMIKGDPNFPTGPTGKFETYVKSAGSGIGCGSGGVLNVRASSKGSADGLVTIEKSKNGIAGGMCQFTIRNATPLKSNVKIKSNGNGIWFLDQARGQVSNVSITNNSGTGVSLGMSDFSIDTSEVTGNGSGMDVGQSRVSVGAVLFNNTNSDVSAGTMSSVQFYGWRGKSSFPKALNWDNSFNCWNGGRIDIDGDALVQTLGTKYDFRDCVYLD